MSLDKYKQINLTFAYQMSSIIKESINIDYEYYTKGFVLEIIEKNKLLLVKFSKFTILHFYIEKEIWNKLNYETSHYMKEHECEIAIEKLYNIVDLYNPLFYKEIDVFDLLEQENQEDSEESYLNLCNSIIDILYQEIEKYMPNMVEDVFYVLFQDREFLLEFNLMLSNIISEIKYEDESEIMRKDGVLKRCSYFPKWLKEGIFFRDKGRCQKCNTNLTGTITMGTNYNWDHIVPLSLGGINDATNIQLLCEKCNKIKSDKEIYTSNKYFRFW
ncbi:HNH endonuclease [Acetoanaerobium noterae]|uniref:HNH endonuclease n=1 Tax=Acetoanaerobium noterae TaxID=745369 RepID=UPI00331CEA46